MEYSYTRCSVSIHDGALKNRTGINIQDELLVYRMGYYFPARCISIRKGVLVNGIKCLRC